MRWSKKALNGGEVSRTSTRSFAARSGNRKPLTWPTSVPRDLVRFVSAFSEKPYTILHSCAIPTEKIDHGRSRCESYSFFVDA